MRTVRIIMAVFCLGYFFCPVFGQSGFGKAKLKKTNISSASIACEHSPADFRGDFNVCNIYQVDFLNTSLSGSAVSWNFGDGSTGIGTDTISHVYNAEGIYTVMLVSLNESGCPDTTSKKFILSIDRGNIFSNKDLSICSGDTARLPGDSDALINCWSPITYLNRYDIYNPLCNPSANISYQYNILKKDPNLVNNASFSKGNVGFSSQYIYDSLVNTSGHYFVGPKPKQWNPDYENCFLDTLNAGDTMMIINGATEENLTVWESNTGVSPNTNYAFSFFAQSLTQTNSIILQVSINGGEVIGSMQIPGAPCKRKKFSTTWFSGSNTSVNITITDLNTNSKNNNFAIDSISLKASSLKTDSIHISIKPPSVFGIQPSATTVCIGDSVTLTASGGDIYSWYPAATVASPNAQSSPVFPSSNTLYKIVITESDCRITDSVFAIVNVKPKPIVTVSKSNDVDCAIVQSALKATGGISYRWQPEGTLSNPYIFNPLAMPGETTTYRVQVTGENSCIAEDSVRVNVITDETMNLYLVPTAFTPNNDGVNDCFSVRKWGYVKGLQFLIYNRWGNPVFSSTDASKCWDGNYKGLPQPPGSYIYFIKGNTICGYVVRKGTLVLLR